MAKNPTFSPDQDMDNVTPQDLQDAQTRTKERKAYKDASRIAPEPSYDGGNRLMAISKGMKADRKAESADRASRVNAMGDTYKKGGSVSSASSRADGIAQRGKTKGTFVMCGGGMARGKK